MKFYEYLDTIYVNGNIKLSQSFDLKLQAETRAVPALLDMQRKYFRTLAYFKFIFGFFVAKATGKYPIRIEIPQAPSMAKPEPLKVVDGTPT